MYRDEALRIVDSFYAAALGEAEWSAALALLADGMGGSAGTLEIQDLQAGKVVHFESVRIDPASIPVYVRDFGAINPRAQFMLRSQRRIGFDHLFMTEEGMDRDPFYADFLAPSDLRYFVAAQSPLLDGRIKGVVAVQRSGRVRGLVREHVEEMKLLAPNIARALRLFWTRARHDIDPDHLDRLLAGHGLTPSERRLASALACGDTLSDYASRAGLSMNTVYTHYRHIKEKLDAPRQAELVSRLRSL